MTTETGMQMPDWLGRQAQTYARKDALEWDGGTITYHQLYQEVTRCAAVLRKQGVQAGRTVALLARDGIKYAKAIHAIMQANAIVVPLNWRLTPAELAWQLEDAQVSLVLADDALYPLAQQAIEKVSAIAPLIQLEDLFEAALRSDEVVVRQHVGLDDVHAIIYTSGTTGHPKGTLVTYGNEWWSATASALNFGLDLNEKWLVPMPLFHVGGLSVLMRSLFYGTTAYIQDRFDAQAVNRAIDTRGVTILSVVPTMLQRMLELRQGAPYPETLRCVLLGGSAAPQPLLQEAQTIGIPVAQSYGLTETASQFCTLAPADGLRKLGSSGRPLLPNELRVDAPPGQVGEIVVRGPSVTPGYWNRPEATQAAIREGWLYTGDLGYLDDEGYLYVVDRRKDLIVSGGENIYPAELEAVLIQHQDVREAAVVGEAHGEWGQVPVAFVALEPHIDRERWDAAGLETYCREHLAGYKIPKRFVIVPELPRNASGKLLRRTLREWLEHEKPSNQSIT